MGKRTALYSEHFRLHAQMVEFGGWDMPLHYGSQIEEHHYVRRSAGMFDVSHMGVVDIKGTQAQAFLRYVLANNVDKLKHPGKALYGCMLNEKGGVIDDLITYYVSSDDYRLVVNAATMAKDLHWLQAQAKHFSVNIHLKPDYAMIAVQGPEACIKVGDAFPRLKASIDSLLPFHFTELDGWFIARTGYTGEDGVEMILPMDEAIKAWNMLIQQGVHPCGLGARDTLRLEAGLNLYGQDMDESVTPLESNLGWTVAFNSTERDFIGRQALEAQRNRGVPNQLIGLVLEEKGILRAHQKVFVHEKFSDREVEVGCVTSGTYSPTLKKSIAFARVSSEPIETGKPLQYYVEIRDKLFKVSEVQPPFFRRQQK